MLTDNSHGLVVSAGVTQADGYGEREAAKAMFNEARQALPGDEPITITLGADKAYDAEKFIDSLQVMNVLPHVAQNKSGRQSSVPDAIADSEGYAISQQKRKLIEQGFGWAKTLGRTTRGAGARAAQGGPDVCADDGGTRLGLPQSAIRHCHKKVRISSYEPCLLWCNPSWQVWHAY